MGSHAHFGKRHVHHHHKKAEFEKRGGKVCEFPKDAGLVEVTPHMKNAGWAMAPDMPCKPGMYCPYACPSGQLMAQWDPKAKTYEYPQAMNGGLYCNENGEIEKPFPGKDYCYDGVGTVQCKNKAKKNVAFCQTVLPGYEDMLIPTDVENDAILAVPDDKYWASTAAHYYINPPGVTVEEACVWGTSDKPIGNWSPYVAGANKDSTGNTFLKLGWNPIYLEPATPFRNEVPDWGVRVECEGCTGLPCEINPNIHKVNEILSDKKVNEPGAGGATFCVVGVPDGVTATIEVFTKDGGDAGDIELEDPEDAYSSSSKAYAAPTTFSKKPEPTSSIRTSTTPSETPSTSFSSSYVAPTISSSYVAPSTTSSSSTHVAPVSTSISSSTYSLVYSAPAYPTVIDNSTAASTTTIIPVVAITPTITISAQSSAMSAPMNETSIAAHSSTMSAPMDSQPTIAYETTYPQFTSSASSFKIPSALFAIVLLVILQ
ncbi:hypothetical protein EDC01DRAFT_613918 [Geopyxis carbonaria]|nr:hypothetical protein EDC01DRAFT_613918 [Geopyxis carbonaria]